MLFFYKVYIDYLFILYKLFVDNIYLYVIKFIWLGKCRKVYNDKIKNIYMIFI